jgi:hypothetical protein
MVNSRYCSSSSRTGDRRRRYQSSGGPSHGTRTCKQLEPLAHIILDLEHLADTAQDTEQVERILFFSKIYTHQPRYFITLTSNSRNVT